MSDAPKGVSERMLRLTGFPEQVQAAMNLVQVGMLLQACHLSKHSCMDLWQGVRQRQPPAAYNIAQETSLHTHTCSGAFHQHCHC